MDNLKKFMKKKFHNNPRAPRTPPAPDEAPSAEHYYNDGHALGYHEVYMNKNKNSANTLDTDNKNSANTSDKNNNDSANTLDTKVANVLTKVKTLIEKNVNLVSKLDMVTGIFLKGLYILIFFVLFLIIIALILEFLFGFTIISGVSILISVITFFATIIIFIFMAVSIVIKQISGKKYKDIIKSDENSFLILIKSLISSLYFFFVFFLVSMPFGFLLSLSYFAGPSFHTSVIDKLYKWVMILCLVFIFILFFLPLIHENLKKTNNFKPTFFILSVTILVFLSMTKLFKYISDTLLEYLLIPISDDYLTEIRETLQEYNDKSTGINITNKMSVLFESMNILNFVILDDNSSMSNKSKYYLVCILIYLIFILGFVGITIGLFYNLINIKILSEFFGNTSTKFISKYMKKILNREPGENLIQAFEFKGGKKK